jgi:predicted dinucleotide-binding enzyme
MGVEEIAKVIEQTSLVGMLALSLGAIIFLTKKVFAQQKIIQDMGGAQVKQQSDQNDKLIKLLEDSTTASVNQTNSNEKVVKSFEDMRTEVAARGPQLQTLNETMKRVMREVNLDPD